MQVKESKTKITKKKKEKERDRKKCKRKRKKERNRKIRSECINSPASTYALKSFIDCYKLKKWFLK